MRAIPATVAVVQPASGTVTILPAVSELRRCGFDTATLGRLWADIWAGVSRLNAESARIFA